MSGVKRDRNNARFPTIGYGYVILPEGVTRSKYIKTCYRRERVSILLDQGGSPVWDCYITQNAIQQIKFPSSSENLGSLVCFVSQEFNTKPIIIGVISKTGETQLLDENSFKARRSIGNSSVDIEGNGDGELFVNVESTDEATIKLNVVGENSKIELNCDGTTTINSQNEVNINSLSKVVQNFIDNEGNKDVTLTINSSGLKYEDQKGNVFEIKKEDGKINLFQGSEPLVKGSELKTQLDQNNTYLTTLTTATSTALKALDALVPGLSSAFDATMTATQKGNFSNIKSTKSFTD